MKLLPSATRAVAALTRAGTGSHVPLPSRLVHLRTPSPWAPPPALPLRRSYSTTRDALISHPGLNHSKPTSQHQPSSNKDAKAQEPLRQASDSAAPSNTNSEQPKATPTASKHNLSPGPAPSVDATAPSPASQPVEDTPPPLDDFLTTIFDEMEPYIDTYEVYKQLTTAGFTPEQSDEVILLLIAQLSLKLGRLLTIYSQHYELENETYLFESAQQELNVDITRNRENHINEAIAQINAMEQDYGVISDELNNHFIQMKNDTQVAINDQKSENTLMSKKIMLRIQETNHKITTELNMAMRSEIESLRWHLSRLGLITILAVITTACLAFYWHKSRMEKRSKAKSEFIPLVIYEPSEFDEDDYHADLDPESI